MTGTGIHTHRAPARAVSLRARLTLWVVAIAIVIQLTLSVVIMLYQTAALDRFFSDRLQTSARAIAGAVRAARCRVTSSELWRMTAEAGSFVIAERTVAALYDAQGLPIASTVEPPIPFRAVYPADEARLGGMPVVFTAEVADLGDALGDASRARLAVQRISDGSGSEFLVLIATTDSHYEQMIRLARRVLFLALPVGVLGAGVAGWLVAGFVVHPLRKLREIAAGIVSEQTAQAEEAGPALRSAEFHDLTVTLEEVRDRVRGAYIAGDRLMASVSHEIRTPIAVLLAEAQTVDARRLPPDGRRFVRSVIDEMRRLSRTVESSLLLTKIRAGKSLMDHAPCEINEFVMDAAMTCTLMARQYKVAIMPILGAAQSARRVVGDCDLLRVMLDNIIRNAIRFSPEGSRVIVRVDDSTDRCAVAVRDYGPGIPDDIRGTLFEPLVQASSEEGRGRGVGLGLTIAQTIAELHAGSISVANMPDGGCEFTIHLPSEPDEPAPPNGSGSAPPSSCEACAPTLPAATDGSSFTPGSGPRDGGAPTSG